jgi:ATP-dependent DNA helicase RecQ
LTAPLPFGNVEEQFGSLDLTDDSKLSVLKTIFGHDSFRGKQEEAINAILEGKNCLIVMPTGGGKSVCYSVPAIVSGGVTVVICPLLSLMMDQVNMLRSKGLNVCYLNSSVPQSDRDVIVHNMLSEAPDYNFVFLTPETATSSDIVDVLSKMKSNGTLTYIVIDECHCIDMWGFDFRPAYGNLGIFASLNCQVIALTATCTPRTEEIILSSLNLTSATTIRQTCDRPNISLIVKPKKGDGKEQATNMIVNEHKDQCGIVYCTERATTLDITYCLQTKGVNATYFHGALDPYKKKANFDAWCEGRALVMCATVAFGMGINKANVRFVIHLGIPQSIECYAQEFGRAGRDGEESTSCLLFRFEDRTKQLKMISALPDSEHRSFKIQNLNEMVKFCIMPHCRRIQLVEYFGEGTREPCDSKCDFCLGGARVDRQDGKDDALHVLSCLENMQRLHPKVTLQHLTLTYRGSKRKEIVAKAYNTIPEFGKGKDTFSDASLKQFIQLLISDSVIVECLRDTKDISTTPYLISGKKEDLLRKGELLICKYIYG